MRRVVVAAIFLGILAAASSSFAADKEPSRAVTAARADAVSPLARLVDRGRSLLVGGALTVTIAAQPTPVSTGRVRHIQCGAVRACLLVYGDPGCWYDQDGVEHCGEPAPGPCGGQEYQDPGTGTGGY